MDLWQSLRVVRRHWLAALLVVVLTIGACFYAASSISPDYQAEGKILLLSPSGNDSNPLLEFGSSLNVVSSVLIASMDDPATVRRLVHQGASANYVIGTGSEGPGPLITVRAVAGTAPKAVRSTRLVMKELKSQLDARQSSVRADARIDAETLTSPSETTSLQGSRLRALAALLAVGLCLAVAVPFLIEGLTRSRRGREPRWPGDSTGGSGPTRQIPDMPPVEWSTARGSGT